MKYPTRLSDAVHILAFIALYPDCDLTSNKLAESIQTNPAYVRQLMSALRKGGLLVSVKGHPRPALAREPEKIRKFYQCVIFWFAVVVCRSKSLIVIPDFLPFFLNDFVIVKF